MLYPFVLTLLLCGIGTEQAKVLMFFNSVSRSHYILGEALGMALADKGHEVTMVSPFKTNEQHPNYKQIILEGLVEQSLSAMYNFASRDMATVDMLKFLFNVRNTLANYTMYHSEVRKLVNSRANFDIFITEFNLNECIFGFGQYYNAIPVLVNPTGVNPWITEIAGFTNYFSIDYNIISSKLPKTFYERAKSTLLQIAVTILDRSRLAVQEKLYDDFFRPLHKNNTEEFPSLTQLWRNFSLILQNNNIAIAKANPQFPNMVNVGGLHIKPKKLPENLQDIMDNASEGVILFSLGGNLKSSNIPKEQLNAILVSLSKIKQQVLWKWEMGKLANKPKNVIIQPWLPQQDILAHNNTVGFITHGGMLSQLEAVYFGVPMLGIPITGDQFMNVARAVEGGFALSIELNDITEDSFTEVLNQVINDSRYRDRVRELSAVFRDSPYKQSPLETAVSAIEYVLRHKGAPFLRSPTTDTPFYEKLFLDILAAFACILIASSVLIYWLGTKLYSTYCSVFIKANSEKKTN